ncbi:MAG: hypothetical protein D6812_02150 [Deltaproteobacteria bacterium]|nr:MAG: hypothetical protein D6812_02150 [Deltaproteobacteria bacterium]
MPMTPSQMLLLQLAQAKAPVAALSAQTPAVPDANELLAQVAPNAAPQAPTVPTAPTAPEKPPTPEEAAALFGLNPHPTSPEVIQRQLEEVQKLITGETGLDEKPVNIFYDILAPSKAKPRRGARAAKDATSPIGMALRQYETRLAEALDRINAQQAAAEATQQEALIEDQKRALAAAILFGNRGGLTPQAAAQFAQAGGQMSLEPTVATKPATSPLDSLETIQALGLIPQQEVSNLLSVEQEKFKQGPQFELDQFNAETSRMNAQTNAFNAATERQQLLFNRAKTLNELENEFSTYTQEGRLPPGAAQAYLVGLEDPNVMATPQWQRIATLVNINRGRTNSVAQAIGQLKDLAAMAKDLDEAGADMTPVVNGMDTLIRNLYVIAEDPNTPGGAALKLTLDNLTRTGALKGVVGKEAKAKGEKGAKETAKRIAQTITNTIGALGVFMRGSATGENVPLTPFFTGGAGRR